MFKMVKIAGIESRQGRFYPTAAVVLFPGDKFPLIIFPFEQY